MAFNWYFLDVTFFVLITLAGVAGLMRRGAPVSRLVLWACVLGFLSEIKFTYLVLAAAAALAGVACLAFRRSWGRAAAVAAAFAASAAVAWMGAGQSPANLFAYVRHSIEIASGYGDAMGLDEAPRVFLCGAALAAACAAFAWGVWRAVPERGYARCAGALVAFSMFVMWKEGFTRADGHVMGFFALVIILAPVLPGLLFPERRWHGFDAAPILCLLGMAAADPGMLERVPRIVWERVYGNAAEICRIGSLPARWQRSYEEACAAAALPAAAEAVGAGSVDVYNSFTGAAILNGMNLSARPIFQSYSAYTPDLEELNLEAFRSGGAPDFLMWGDDVIDGRYPGQDDARLLAALPGHYTPLFSEGGFWIFKRTGAPSLAPPERRPVLGARVRLGEEVVLPPRLGHALWLRADAVPDLLGRARSLLYKPARIDLVTTDDVGQRRSWRLVPRVARDGFVLVPTLLGGSDMAMFLRGEAGPSVRSFHFESPGSQGEFWSHVDVGVFALPGLPLTGPLVELGILERPAISVSSSVSAEIIDLGPVKALQLHAEGELVIGVPPGSRRVSFGYGIREGAYTGGNATDGVEFSLDAVWASGRTERLWRRYLDPLARPGDRGTQNLDLELPADSPARLVLRTGAGPKNDSRWDWSYVCTLRFAEGGGP
jgi:hypothetical protein